MKKKNIFPVYIIFCLKLYILYMIDLTHWFLLTLSVKCLCMVVKTVHKTLHLYINHTQLMHGLVHSLAPPPALTTLVVSVMMYPSVFILNTLGVN